MANQVFRGQELASEVRPWQWLGRTAGGRYAGLGRTAGGERRAEGSRFERSAWAPRIQRGEERMGHGMGVAVGGVGPATASDAQCRGLGMPWAFCRSRPGLLAVASPRVARAVAIVGDVIGRRCRRVS